MSETKSLQRLVQDRADELGITSTRELTRRAKGTVSYETVRRILTGKHSGRLTDEIAEGLAAALSLPVARIREVAELAPTLGPWYWPPRFEVLDAEERRLLEGLASKLAAAKELSQTKTGDR